ncbi:MAG: hypothetical protein JWM12_3233, partial [Ilumatobacteraceae bacterium]|nr:hypothetical protein [Ilumatobacteraceae bacterium]
ALTLLGDDPDGTGAGPPIDSGEAVVIAAALNQRAMALIVSDPQRALRTAQRSLQLTEAAIDDTDRVLLPDALSVVYFAAIQAAEPEVAERTFARLLRCADDPSYEGTLGALAVAISLTAHAQTKLARGLEDTTPEQILGIIGRAAELLEPLVATLSFAAVAHADAWLTAIGAGLVDDDDIAALAATLDAELRTLVDVFPAAGDALARLFLARIAHEPDGEVRAELAQEAVALADNPTSPAATITFVNANVAAMTVFPLGAAMNDAARRRLIVSADRWRSLGSRGEVMLLSLRSSEVWVLVGQGRVHEARAMVELAAHDAAVLDPRDPEVAMGLAVLALNEGVVLMLGRDNEAARRSLLRSVRHNHHPTDDARRDFAVLAALNLACVAVERGRPRVAFRHIARARRLGADVRPEIHVRLLLFEARAVAATGDLAGAHELTVDAINRLIDIVRDDPSLLPVLGEALNDGGAFAWTDAELRLGDQPIWRDIRRHYAPRTSTPAEIAMRLATFLASAVGAEEQVGLRTAVRQRRVADPEAFDRGWLQATGDHPAWLDFDLEQYNLVIGWFNTNSWLESREFLRANPQLLEPVSREMLDELGLDDEPDDDEESMEAIHRALLVDAQAIGIDDAFAALIGYNAIQEWDADGYSPEAYDRLRDDLRHPRALDRFTTPEARVLAASLRAAFELIDRGEVTLAVDALREDFRQDWARVLDVARSATDVQRFAALVTLAATAADDVFEAASITSARVVAAVLTGAVEEADAIVAELGSAAERSAVEDALLDAMRTHRDRTTQLATMLDHLRSAT